MSTWNLKKKVHLTSYQNRENYFNPENNYNCFTQKYGYSIELRWINSPSVSTKVFYLTKFVPTTEKFSLSVHFFFFVQFFIFFRLLYWCRWYTILFYWNINFINGEYINKKIYTQKERDILYTIYEYKQFWRRFWNSRKIDDDFLFNFLKNYLKTKQPWHFWAWRYISILRKNQLQKFQHL